MRTYGRVTNPDGSKTWVVVTTNANGSNDMVWLTTLIQVLKLGLNESPFYANYGIGAQQAVMSQVAPDYDVAKTQLQFSGYFASLAIARAPADVPTYAVKVTTHQGVSLNTNVQVPA